MLRSGKLELGILKEVGGRVVLLRESGEENLLKSNPELWNESPDDRYKPGDKAKWKEYGGHIVWLGPQSGWWNQQDAYPKNTGKAWPPDPYLIYGNYDVVESTDTYAKLEGPASPVSGVRLIKEYWLEDERTVRLRVTAENIRDSAVNWGLWTNTRFPGETRSYIPLDSNRNPEFSFKGDWAEKSDIPFGVVDGFFTFLVDEPVSAGKSGWDSKVFATPKGGLLAAFPQDKVFIKKANLDFADRVHNEHGFAEIYNNVPAQPDGWSLLELEFHGPYQTLIPGESMSFEETWQLFDYDGLRNTDTHVNFLKGLE